MITVVVILALIAVAVVWMLFGLERYRPAPRAPHRMAPTTEVHIDPVTGRRQRVWADAVSGDRAFVDEPAPDGGGEAIDAPQRGALPPPE